MGVQGVYGFGDLGFRVPVGHMGVSQYQGHYLGRPYNKDYILSGSICGTLNPKP